jgi:hypothetical protein
MSVLELLLDDGPLVSWLPHCKVTKKSSDFQIFEKHLIIFKTSVKVMLKVKNNLEFDQKCSNFALDKQQIKTIRL